MLVWGVCTRRPSTHHPFTECLFTRHPSGMASTSPTTYVVGLTCYSVLRHHAYAWCPHHLIPVHPPSVRDGEYFANNLRCWAHHRYFGTMLTHGVLTTLFLFTRHPSGMASTSPTTYVVGLTCIRYFGTMLTHGVLTTLFLFTRHPSGMASTSPTTYVVGLTIGTSAPCLRMVSSPPYSCSPAIRPGWRVLRQQLTLLGSPAFGTSAPCLRMVASPPYSCSPAIRPGWRVLRQQLTLLGSPSVLRHHAYAWCPHHLIPVHPPSVRDGEYFANNLRCWAHLHSVLRHQLTHGGLTTSCPFTSHPSGAASTSPTTYVVGLT